MWNYKINNKGLLKQRNLLYLVFGAVLAAGVFFRVAGFDTHVTYIDEILCLAGGDWNSEGRELQHDYASAWDYAKKVSLHDGVTYAPLQFLLTYFFIEPHKPYLSLQALAASRIPSVIIGCLGMGLLLLLFYILSGRRLSYSALFAVTLLALSRINIVNSQQNHTYIIGVLAFIFLLLAVLWLYTSRKFIVWAGVSALLCLVPFSNYQTIPILILAIGIVVCAIWLDVIRTHAGWKMASVRTLLLVPALVIAGLVARWVMINRGDYSIAWWAVDYSYEYSGKGFFEKLLGLVKNIYFVVESLLLSGDVRLINLIGVAAFLLILIGGCRVLVRKRFRVEINILPLLLSVAVCGLFIFLYLTKVIPLSPSRHTLILTPAVLVIFFYCSHLIENSVNKASLLQAYKYTLASLSVFLLLGAAVQYPEFYRKKTDAFWPEKILEYSTRENINLILTDWYTYDKAYIFLQKEIAEGRIRLKSAGEEAEFPDEPFLLVGQNINVFYPLYDSKLYEFGYRSRLLYENNPRYDFEPSPRIDFYWPNRMLIYRVDPAVGGKPRGPMRKPPECGVEGVELPAESGYVFVQSVWQYGHYLNVESGLRSAPVQNEWWTAEWVLEKAGNEPVVHYSIRQRWNKEQLYIDVGDGNQLKVAHPDFPKEHGHWVFEPASQGVYRIRSLQLPHLYINTESQHGENPEAREYKVQASQQESHSPSLLWRLCESPPPP